MTTRQGPAAIAVDERPAGRGCTVHGPDPAVIVESIPHIAWTASPDGSTTYFNRRGTDYTGGSAETTYDWNWVTLVHPDDVERARAAWQHAAETGTDYELDYRIRRHDGVFRWHAFRALPLRNPAGEVLMWIGTATDIQEHKEVVGTLRRVEGEAVKALTLLESIEAAAPVGYKFVDREFRIRRTNESLARSSGQPMDEMIGRTVAETVPDLWPQLEDVYGRALAGETVSDIEISRPHAEEPDRMRHWLASYYPVWLDGEIIGVGNLVLDITDRKEAEEFRTVVMDNVAEGIYALDADGCVTYMNKAASLMLGWTEDDLRGKPMHEAVHFQRADGTPLPAVDCPLLQVRSQGRTIRIIDDAFTRKDGSIFPVGYSSAPLNSGSEVRGVVVAFRDSTAETEERAAIQKELAALTWVGRIRDALDEDRLVLHSQPIVPLTGGRPSEELLLRMIGRNGEIIQPGGFLPIAEKYGLIEEIDRWVITQAVRLAATGRRVIEANLSAASIASTDLLPFIERQLAETGADPANLVFEITETALMDDLVAGERFAFGLAGLGCGVALDDFGTGFASFTYLKRLRVDYLKIDVEFVRELDTTPSNRHLVRAIVSLARSFGLRTIAEGVENDEVLAILRAEGVDFAQGFHLGRPAPLPAADPAAPHQTRPAA
jgi:PAS domain S-box-containing protein